MHLTEMKSIDYRHSRTFPTKPEHFIGIYSKEEKCQGLTALCGRCFSGQLTNLVALSIVLTCHTSRETCDNQRKLTMSRVEKKTGVTPHMDCSFCNSV